MLMEGSIQLFNYQGNEVAFDLKNDDLMINATEMAAIFNKRTSNFLRLPSTKSFIKELRKTKVQDSNMSLESADSDLIVVVHGGRNNGTWVHRILALEFASWLNPVFKVWMAVTIDRLLFGDIRTEQQLIREDAIRHAHMKALKIKLRADSKDFVLLEQLQLESRQFAYRRNKEYRKKQDSAQARLLLN